MIDHWRLDDYGHRIQRALDYQIPATYTAGCVLSDSATPLEYSELLNPDFLTQPGPNTGRCPSIAETVYRPFADNRLCEVVIKSPLVSLVVK